MNARRVCCTGQLPARTLHTYVHTFSAGRKKCATKYRLRVARGGSTACRAHIAYSSYLLLETNGEQYGAPRTPPRAHTVTEPPQKCAKCAISARGTLGAPQADLRPRRQKKYAHKCAESVRKVCGKCAGDCAPTMGCKPACRLQPGSGRGACLREPALHTYVRTFLARPKKCAT